MILNLLNLYSLIFAQFNKINDMVKDLEELYNSTLTSNSSKELGLVNTSVATILIPSNNVTNCLQVCQNLTLSPTIAAATIATAIVLNITTTAIPKLMELLTVTTESNFSFTADIATTTEGFHPTNYTGEFLSSTEFSNDGNTTAYENEYFNVTHRKIYERDAFWLLNTIDDFKDKFEDYLSYILNSFDDDVNYDNSSIIDFPDYDDYNATIPIRTTDILNKTQEYLKTTLPTMFNLVDDSLEAELSTFYDDISSTVAWVQETFNTTKPSQFCHGCESVLLNKPEIMNLPSSCTENNSSNSTVKLQSTYAYRSKLRSLCWETMFGQELVKLTVMDLVFTALGIIAIDFLRGLFVRGMNRCWCWDLEKKFPEYGEFKVAENILHLVNNQGLVWMGMFFSPGLLLINVFKLITLMYLRSWAVMTCNVPHEVIFRASRSNNFYFALLLTMLFLCVLPVGYAVVWVRPSRYCGPFSQYDRMFHIFTKAIKEIVPESLHKTLDYIASPGIVIPLLILLILIIYYLISLTNALREANEDLKVCFCYK